MNDIFTEFRRIGFEPDELGGLVMTGPKEELLAWLLTVPSGIGIEEFRRWIPTAELPPTPAWDLWPDVSDVFTVDEYWAAFQFINASPEHLIEAYTRPPGRRVDTVLLSLLWHVSAELAARVDAFRATVRAQRIAEGMSAELLAAGEAAFEAWRYGSASQAAQYREWEALHLGPTIWIRFVPSADEDAIDTLLAELSDDLAASTRLWQCEPHDEGGTAAINFVVGTSARVVDRLVRQLLDLPSIADVEVHHGDGDGPSWPMARFEDDDDQEGRWR